MEALFLILFFTLFAGVVVVDAVAPAIREALTPLMRDAMKSASDALPASPATATAPVRNRLETIGPRDAKAGRPFDADTVEALESELRRVREERDFYRDLAEGGNEPDEVTSARESTADASGKLGTGAVADIVSTALEFL